MVGHYGATTDAIATLLCSLSSQKTVLSPLRHQCTQYRPNASAQTVKQERKQKKSSEEKQYQGSLYRITELLSRMKCRHREYIHV